MLIVLVLGSMYAGYATPSEAAAVGALGALVVSMVQGTLTLGNIRAAAFSTVRTTSMIGLIVCGAVFLSVVMGYLGIPREIANAIAALHLGPIALIMLLLVFYALLGTVLDGISSIVMTLPITLPLALAAGFDKVWFGVFIVIVVEMAQITPPVGFNLFVIQGLTGEPVMRIAVAAFPFFIIMFLLAILITLFPEVVTWLPDAVTLRG
jgi:tripartite ATP-independent transporter DctM subunit